MVKRMSSKNMLDNVLQLGNSAFELNDTTVFRNVVLPELETIFQSQASIFSGWHQAVQGAGDYDLYFPQWDDSFLKLYYNRLHSYDPIFSWLGAQGYASNHSVALLSGLVDLKEFNKTPLYRHLMQPNNCQYSLTLALHCGVDLIGTISLLRSPEQKDFSATEIQAARVAAPILSGVYNKLLLDETIEEQSLLLESLAEISCDAPWLILSSSLNTVCSSKDLDELKLTLKRHGINDIDDLLSRSDNISKYLLRFKSTTAASRRQLLPKLVDGICLPDGAVLEVVLDRLVADRSPGYLHLSFRFRQPGAPDKTASNKFGFTLRELQIAELIASGHATEQVGQLLCISPWTVKNHLKRIYSKANVKNRVSLSKLL